MSCKLSILLAKFHLWLSIIIILFVSSSFSTISNSEHQAELGSRTRLRARAVADQQIYPTSVNNQLRARCQGATCKSTKPPLSTRFVEDSAKPNDNRAIHHQAKISTRNVKSSRSVKARDCTLLGPKKDPPVPETDKQAKEKPADPKKQSEAKSLTQTNDQSILKNNPSPTETTKSDFARRPFPYEKYHPDLKFIPMSFPIVRSTLQPATPASNPAPSKPRTQTKQILPPAKPLGEAADPPSPAPTSQPKPLSRVSAGSRNSNKPKNSNSSSKWLSAHNDIRAKYSAKPLTWSSKLEATAQAWADRCVFEHSKGGGYGENIAAGQPTIESVVQDWVYGKDECSAYNPRTAIYSHFTQVIWQGTTEVGCAASKCANVQKIPLSNAFFWVCQYSPPGNVFGEFGRNVRASAGQCIK